MKERESEGRTHTHTQTYKHAHKQRAHGHAHTSIVRCPLKFHEVKGHAFIFIHLRCLEILHLFLLPARTPRPKSFLALFSCSTPTLSYRIPQLLFLSRLLFCCLVLDLLTIFATARPLLVLAEAAAAAVFAPASLPLVLADATSRSLRTCSSPSGTRRCCCRRSLCTCSSVAGAHTGFGSWESP